MNFLYFLNSLEDLQNRLQGTVTLSVYHSSGLVVRVMWLYKEKVIHWQYLISRTEMELVNDNSAFVLYLIEKAKAEYALKVSEIDND